MSQDPAKDPQKDQDEPPAIAARLPVTCTIIACDEADRIGRCIASVRDLVADVVVIDSGSRDATVAVAEAHGARVIYNPWPGYGPQKRFAEDAARHDWILSLDADEWLPQETREEILELFAQGEPDLAGIRFRIPTVYPGREKPRPFAGYHAHVRLYDRRRVRIPASLVHDAIDFDPSSMRMAQHPIHHESIRSLSHLVEKNIAYFHLQAVEMRRSRLTTLPRLVIEPFAAFFKYYLLRRHVTGGLFGLRYALTVAYIRTYRLAVLAGFFHSRTEAARRGLEAGRGADATHPGTTE
ncbi:MAG: glycosyltransferase family 2 protein [Salinarimonas sp.]|nr:glycosyltransferase family 2 protein [Salinarimonas sp.]